jgi:uncharacterized protein (DUF2461 family)
MTWFKGQAVDFYDSGLQKLVPRLNKCLDSAGACLEKSSSVQVVHSQCRFCKLKMYTFRIVVSLLSGHASRARAHIYIYIHTHTHTCYFAVLRLSAVNKMVFIIETGYVC